MESSANSKESKQTAASKDPLEARFEEDLQKAIALSMESAAMEKFKKNTKPQNINSSGKKFYGCVTCIFNDLLID